MPTPFWPDLEGDAVMFEDLPGCIGRAIGPPLIGRSRVSEASASLIIVGQGVKRGYLGNRTYEYDGGNYLLMTLPLTSAPAFTWPRSPPRSKVPQRGCSII
jgi:hypothetical protein